MTEEKQVQILSVSPDQRELIKRTIATGATDDELHLYIYDCQRRGVHPLDKKIHFTKRGGRYVPIVGIDFLRERASKTGECLGISDPIFTGDPKDDDFTAVVTVRRLVANNIAEFQATARWTEYCPAAGQDHMWQKMPHTMLGKCAEALALRKAFPGDETGGLYIPEEMEQAGKSNHRTVRTVETPQSPSTILCPAYGKFAKRPVSECDDEWLEKYRMQKIQEFNNPEKAKFKASNKKLIDAIIEEQERRRLNKDLDQQASDEGGDGPPEMFPDGK